MEFMVTAYDGTDSEALSRRMAAREAHLQLGAQMIQAGSLLYAAAILNDSEQMIGSLMVVNFATREALEEWLAIEPYVTGGVWKNIDVKRCRPGAAFVK